MWVSRVQSKISGSLMLNVFNVGFKSSNKIFWFPIVGCVRCGFQEFKVKFWFSDVGCVRCGFQEFKVKILVL